MILLLTFYILFPALIIYICNRVNFLGKIGPIFLLYLVGLIIGNIGLLPNNIYAWQDGLSSALVPLAIPLMLFGCNFREWKIGVALKALVSGFAAIIVVVIAAYFIFKGILSNNPLIDGELNKLAGMLCGVYTGGTANLASLKMMLDVDNELYILANSYDMLISSIYFMFLFSGGIALFRIILPHYKRDNIKVFDNDYIITNNKTSNKKEFLQNRGSTQTSSSTNKLGKKSIFSILKAVGLSLLITAISGGVSFLFCGKIEVAVVILTLTTLSILASFNKRVNSLEMSFEAGMYLIYIFSLVIASMADFSKFNFADSGYILAFIIFIVFGSLIVQTLLSKVLKIDADTMIVTSVSLINSPPFVPVVASATGNKDIMITGITVGLAGYALGNYLGYIISIILSS